MGRREGGAPPRRFRMPRGRSWLWPSVLAALVAVVVSAGAAAAIETDTVSSFWQGLWWSISLITTVGFIGSPPQSAGGAALSVVLMVAGFLLLAMVSASLAALFVREEDAPHEAEELAADTRMLEALLAVEARLARLEQALAVRGDGLGGGRTRAQPDDAAAPGHDGSGR